MGHCYDRDVEDARQEFSTSCEAENMLSELRKVSGYCTGPESSVKHGNRMNAVETVARELKEKGR